MTCVHAEVERNISNAVEKIDNSVFSVLGIDDIKRFKIQLVNQEHEIFINKWTNTES